MAAARQLKLVCVFATGYDNIDLVAAREMGVAPMSFAEDKMVKIDKNIVWSAYGNLRTQTALSATIKMIHELGMTVLAEGVETQEQCEWLSQLGCDYLQGYYFSKPLEKEDFLDMMLKSVEEHSSELESMEE